MTKFSGNMKPMISIVILGIYNMYIYRMHIMGLSLVNGKSDWKKHLLEDSGNRVNVANVCKCIDHWQ